MSLSKSIFSGHHRPRLRSTRLSSSLPSGQLRMLTESISPAPLVRSSALLPVSLSPSDNLCTRGVPTTCSSRMLETFVPPTNPRSRNSCGAPKVFWLEDESRRVRHGAPPNLCLRCHQVPGTPLMSPVGPRVVVRRRLPPGPVSLLSARTRAARSVSLHRSAVWWVSSPPMAESAAGDLWPLPVPWIRWVLCRNVADAAGYCRSSLAPTRAIPLV